MGYQKNRYLKKIIAVFILFRVLTALSKYKPLFCAVTMILTQSYLSLIAIYNAFQLHYCIQTFYCSLLFPELYSFFLCAITASYQPDKVFTRSNAVLTVWISFLHVRFALRIVFYIFPEVY